MRLGVLRFLAVLLLAACGATTAHAVQYPPGPGGANPDTLIYVRHIQDPAAVPHPVVPDTTWGIAGIITGFDTFPTGFAIYIQNNAQDGSGLPAPWTGLDIFTGGNNYISLFSPPLAIGDSIVCYGRVDEFQGETELISFNGAFGSNPIIVRRVSTGNPVPDFRRLSVNTLQELPTNPNAEQWEGCLVSVAGTGGAKLRVVRTSLTPGLGTFSSFLAVDNGTCPSGSIGPCDSLFVDGSTLGNPAITPPPVGALVDSVRGIYNQRSRGYRIQIRDGGDLFDSSPPSLNDAYSIHADTIRVVFDRNLTLASAENTANYTLSSTLGSPDAAIRQVNRNVVHLKVTSGLSPCDNEGLTVNGVVNESNNQAMTTAQNRSFYNGICPIASIQAPDPTFLAASPCEDRSRFAGAGSALGQRITTRGVCTISYGSNYWIQDAAGGLRSGTLIFAPSTPLVVGRQYVVAGAIQEFFTETEIVSTVFIKDEGVVAVPAPLVETVGVLRDTTCDASQSMLTGEDYEGTLVRLVDVKTVDERLPGQSFFVAGHYPSNPDTILIDNNVPRTFDPAKNQYVTVTGIQDVSFEAAGTTFRIQPRGDSDIVPNLVLGVDGPAPSKVSFSIAPNPGRTPRVTFGLPRAERVTIGIYDLAGRRITTLVDREFHAGSYFVDWSGETQDGSRVGAGVYFYRMKVGNEIFSARAVRLE
jgi:hypothetical protein